MVLLAGAFGVAVGLIAGYPRRADRRGPDAVRRHPVLAFPGLLLILLILAVVGPSHEHVIAVLALTNWMVYARVVRGIVLSVAADCPMSRRRR